MNGWVFLGLLNHSGGRVAGPCSNAATELMLRWDLLGKPLGIPTGSGRCIP